MVANDFGYGTGGALMPKLGELFGWGGNPFYDAFSSNRNMLSGALLGASANAGDPWAGAAAGAARGGAADDAFAQQQEAEAERVQQINQTAAYLREQGAKDLAAAVEGGMMSGGDAFSTWYQQANAQPDLTADMRNYQYAQANPGFAQFIGGAGEAPQIVETYDAETGQPVKGYMQGTTFVPVGGAKAPAARDNPMNSTIQKEIFEADEGVQAGQAVIGGLQRALELNNVAYDGPFADQRSSASALFGDQSGIATQELKNVVTSQALESLKAVFGGMPTEGERKILLEIQGSVDQPKPVREAIYKRAMAAAERRIAANQAKAEGLRSGSYFDPSFGQGAPANATSSGIQWSIEP